jgi:hypothetical protein
VVVVVVVVVDCWWRVLRMVVRLVARVVLPEPGMPPIAITVVKGVLAYDLSSVGVGEFVMGEVI